MLKVSVVVPTYKPGKGFERLIESLRNQTLDSNDFEVIFIDDGSPDDTYTRLKQLEVTYRNFRSFRIPNSGWASAPRNVGIDKARGEYIAFVDHDDSLYPEALEAAYSFAKLHDADVVNGKEARTHDAAWAISTYTEDMANARLRADINPLIPMNPHKLYRRALLIKHSIRFPEGRRVLWEDIFFNIKVLANARVISVMASTPYYHWVQTKGSGSTSFRRSNEEWWTSLTKVFEAIQGELQGASFELNRNQLTFHQYRSRVLGTYNRSFQQRPAVERQMIDQYCSHLTKEFVPREFDAELDTRARIRAYLLRARAFTELAAFAATDLGPEGSVTSTSLAWNGPALVVESIVEWQRRDGEVWVETTPSGSRIYATDPSFRETVPLEIRSIERDLRGATACLGIRSRKDRVVWMIPTENTSDLCLNASGTSASITMRSEIDVRRLAMGARLNDGAWDLNGRAELGGAIQQLPVTHSPSLSAIGFVDGRVVLAYCNLDGALSLDVGLTTKSIWPYLRFGTCTLNRAVIEIDLPEISAFGAAVDHRFHYVLRKRNSLWSRIVHSYKLNHTLSLFPLLSRLVQVRSARLTSRNGSAKLEIDRPRRRGTYDLQILSLTDRKGKPRLRKESAYVDKLELTLDDASPTIRRVG